MKYLELYNNIKSDILRGVYSKHDKLPYIKELMAQYEVSVTTVQNALRLIKKEGLIISVPSKGLFVNKNLNIKKPKKKGDHLNIGVIIQQYLCLAFQSSYFSRIYMGIERATLDREAGSVFPISAREKDIHEVCQIINALDINALITVDMGPKDLNRELESLGLPIVHTETTDIITSRPVLSANNIQGGEIAFKKLYSLGHRKILYISNYFPGTRDIDPSTEKRWQGIKKACRNKTGVKLAKKTVEVGPRVSMKILDNILEEHVDFTGFIASGEFNRIKSFLQKRSPDKTKQVDVVLYSMEQNPAVINNKPIYFCKWDALNMGKETIRYFFKEGKKLPRIKLFPMRIDRNIG